MTILYIFDTTALLQERKNIYISSVIFFTFFVTKYHRIRPNTEWIRMNKAGIRIRI